MTSDGDTLVNEFDQLSGQDDKEPCLFRLPIETMVTIISHLGGQDIVLASTVCRFLHAIIKQSIHLQYQIELFLAGLADDRPLFVDPPPLSRLEKIKDYQERWKTLNWRCIEGHRLTEWCPRYELYMGAFAQLWPTPPPQLQSESDNSEDDDGHYWHSDLKMFYFPSASRGLSNLTEVVYGDLGIRGMRDLVFDRDQELLVVVGLARHKIGYPLNWHFPIYLRSLRTNERHPAARDEVLFLPLSPPPPQRGASLTTLVIGDMLAFFLNPMDGDQSVFALWRWTTGRLLVHSSLDANASSLTFLTEDSFLVAYTRSDVSSGPSLGLFRLPHHLLDVGVDEPAVVTDLQPSVMMLFPETTAGMFRGTNLSGRLCPLPRGTQWRPHTSTEDSDLYTIPAESVAFRATDVDGIFTCSWTYFVYNTLESQHRTSREESQVLITLASSLLRFMDKVDGSHLPLVVPWCEWSHLARLMFDRVRGPWYSPTYGYRFVMPSPMLNALVDPFHVVVLDFNQYAIRKEVGSEVLGTTRSRAEGGDHDDNVESPEESIEPPESSGFTDSGHSRIVRETSFLESLVYKTPPSSSLPYRVSTSRMPLAGFRGLMMSEEHVVNVTPSQPITRKIELQIFSI